ncbi:MAG: hypothetical protein LBV38_07385 [Alistipes sp.]|jgi:hypothetical protein|nr:hypothetical protein [Alistipes sp.]
MKKNLLATIFCLSLCLAGCGPDCAPIPTPELDRVEATLSAEGDFASDLRLDLSLDVRYITAIPARFSLIQTARACSPADPAGFIDEISRMTLTCDRSIRGFSAGQNILTTSADVFWIRNGAPSESPITLGQWLELMNEGDDSSLGGRYSDLLMWRDAYDVAIAFIPEGTDAAAGEYNFTFTMEMRSGTRYETNFAPVTIATL